MFYDDAIKLGVGRWNATTTEKYIIPLTRIYVIITDWPPIGKCSWKIADGKIPLNLQGYPLIQHNLTFTDNCTHVNHVHRTGKNEKKN